MQRFIRLDTKGHWRGTDHVSSMNGLAEESYFENGISCYCLEDKAYALDNLHHYWFKIASIDDDSLEDMQVTIFEGEKVGEGSDWEDLASCERTIKTFPAKEFMKKINELYWDKECDDISEDEYQSKLNELV